MAKHYADGNFRTWLPPYWIPHSGLQVPKIESMKTENAFSKTHVLNKVPSNFLDKYTCVILCRLWLLVKMSEAENEARKKVGRRSVWATCILFIFISVATLIGMSVITFIVLKSCYYSDHFDVVGCRQGLNRFQPAKVNQSFNRK